MNQLYLQPAAMLHATSQACEIGKAHQQNSCLHCEQFMCMQPWFFSIGRLHLGHGLVFAMIQFRFSDSALFFNSHFATVEQSTCATSQVMRCQNRRVRN